MKLRPVSDAHVGGFKDPDLTGVCKREFVDQIEEGDEIAADKGFRVHGLIMEKGASLLLPSFVEHGQLNAEDTIYSQRLSSVRVHVERAFGRMKNYRLFSNQVQMSMVGTHWMVAKAVAFLCNMQEPLYKDMVGPGHTKSMV
eukprot:comp24326_c0_seq1/m.45941 comp24326_c0_seq1/g.45941  ORF comp24326_c0_seq1/g.45941 comp24326_c0_seq1/m.45941 type:complete len:142 (-) comp24326_c0_seq1:50-475(-)